MHDEFTTDHLCSLQTAIKSQFKEYLDKTATLGEWACGVDLALNTYVPENVDYIRIVNVKLLFIFSLSLYYHTQHIQNDNLIAYCIHFC